jgi:hypothetical protein
MFLKQKVFTGVNKYYRLTQAFKTYKKKKPLSEKWRVKKYRENYRENYILKTCLNTS